MLMYKESYFKLNLAASEYHVQYIKILNHHNCNGDSKNILIYFLTSIKDIY